MPTYTSFSAKLGDGDIELGTVGTNIKINAPLTLNYTATPNTTGTQLGSMISAIQYTSYVWSHAISNLTLILPAGVWIVCFTLEALSPPATCYIYNDYALNNYGFIQIASGTTYNCSGTYMVSSSSSTTINLSSRNGNLTVNSGFHKAVRIA